MGNDKTIINCIHPYLHSVSEFLYKCDSCGQFVPKHKTAMTTQPSLIEMPPRIYELNKALWEHKCPWPRIPFFIAKKYGWYISFIYKHEYLIMPVIRNTQAVFYSARLLDRSSFSKYLYPAMPKTYWTSVDPKRFKKTVVFAEGVADAAYVSTISLISSVALLGSWYDGSLNEYLQNKHIRIMMDGDMKGIEAAFRVMQSFKKAGLVDVDVIMLPKDADPTDLFLAELKGLLQK